jgi:16S rRNA (cytosine967-C5)-methyltransferase
MLEAQRLASAVVARVLGGRSLDAEFDAASRCAPSLSASERGAARDLAYGTLRFLGLLEALLDLLLERPLRSARLRALLLVALYQLERTRAAPYAIVDHAVRACEALGFGAAKGLANAVLRTFLRDRSRLLEAARASARARYSHPEWWIAKLRAQYPLHYERVLEAGNTRPPLTLRVNVRRTSLAEYLRRLADSGLAAEPLDASAVMLAKPVPVERIPGFAEGLVSVQDAGAQLAAELLDAHEGMRVLDACAAPGGKSAHLLERVRLDLTALDSDANRLALVRENLERLGLRARLVLGDACEPQAWWDGVPYERILVDAPCSASGVVRRHPDVKWLRRESDIARYAERQLALLEALWPVLAGGGKLLYATCSVFEEENSEVVARFLERHADAERLALPAIHTEPQLPAGLLLPDDRHDGFFYALLGKA